MIYVDPITRRVIREPLHVDGVYWLRDSNGIVIRENDVVVLFRNKIVATAYMAAKGLRSICVLEPTAHGTDLTGCLLWEGP